MISPMQPIVVGTRGSVLARWQADWVCDQLARYHVHTRIEIIHTSGDRQQKGPLASSGGKGLFVKELETALQRGEIDIAIHSLKDVPALQDDEFVLGAFLPRADPRDCLIAAGQSLGLMDIPTDSIVGSCSPRRVAQLLHQRPGLSVEPLRGNVETRLSKVRSGFVGATFLAKAGLDRLGIEDPTLIHPLSIEVMLPAAGQGIVAVEVARRHDQVLEVLAQIDHAPSRWAAEAERKVVYQLGGSCVSPIAAHASIEGNQLTLTALAGDLLGKELLKEQVVGSIDQRFELATELADRLLAGGARSLIGGNNDG